MIYALAVYGPPWPKGKIKAPQVFFPEPGEIESERAKCLGAMARFIEATEREPGRMGLHPVFGSLTLKAWQRLHGLHFEHHLTQFGA